MLNIVRGFGGFSAPDIGAIQNFYAEVLGLTVAQRPEGLEISLPNNGSVFVYPSPTNAPATFTILNFVVKDIDAEVDELVGKGVSMERYPDFPADQKGIVRNDGTHPGPGAIAWFKDPAGNILSLIQE